MPRILGVDIPREKRIEASLPFIFGVGPKRAKDVLTQAKIDFNKRAKDLTDEEIAKITSIVQTSYIVEGDLRRELELDSISGEDSDKMHPDFTRDMRLNSVTVIQLHLKFGVRQSLFNNPFNFN